MYINLYMEMCYFLYVILRKFPLDPILLLLLGMFFKFCQMFKSINMMKYTNMFLGIYSFYFFEVPGR